MKFFVKQLAKVCFIYAALRYGGTSDFTSEVKFIALKHVPSHLPTHLTDIKAFYSSRTGKLVLFQYIYWNPTHMPNTPEVRDYVLTEILYT